MTAQLLRSRNCFGRKDLDGFAHRSWLMTEGFSDLWSDSPGQRRGTGRLSRTDRSEPPAAPRARRASAAE